MPHQAIDDLTREARKKGVILEIEIEDDALWLSRIERTSGPPGAGALIIEQLFDIADDHDLNVHGAIVADHEALIPYYEELGFTVHEEEGRTLIRR